MAADPLIEAGLLDLSLDDELAPTQWGSWSYSEAAVPNKEFVTPATDLDTSTPSHSIDRPSSLQPSPNTPSPIRSLPPELLIDIFTRLTFDILDTDVRWCASPAWIRVTHVCEHWRALCLSTPTIWTRISLANSDLAKVMIARARDAPLTILHGDRSFSLTPSASLTDLLACKPHIAHLRLQIPSSFVSCLNEALLQIIPGLEYLHIDIIGRPTAASFLSLVTAPRLRTLILDGALLSPESDLLAPASDLRELVLTRFPGAFRWRVRDTLRVVARTPLLHRLALTDLLRAPEADDSDDEMDGENDPMVALSELRTLRLHGRTPTIATLIRYLSIPADTTCNFTCVARTPDDCALAACVPKSLRVGEPQKIARVDVRMYITEFSAVFRTDFSVGPALELSLEPERVLNAPYASGLATLRELCAKDIDFSAVRTLSFVCDPVLDPSGAMEALTALDGAMPGVDEIILSATACECLMARIVTVDEVAAESSGVTMFPRVKKVSVLSPWLDASRERVVRGLRARFSALHMIVMDKWLWYIETDK